MKLYTWAVVDMAEQLKLSRAAVERTHQKVSRSLASLNGLEETMKKMALILGEPVRKQDADSTDQQKSILITDGYNAFG